MGSKVTSASRRQSPYLLRAPMMAGWLFADLFLVLCVVLLASQPMVSAAKNEPLHAKHHRVSVVKTAPPELQKTPVNIVVDIPPADLADGANNITQAASQLVSDINQQLIALHLQDRKAGFVLVFASGPVTEISQAIDSANYAIQVLRNRDSATFQGAGGEGLWNGQGNYLHFQIFFFV